MFAPSIGSHNNTKITERSGDNVVVDAAAARDRVAANTLICAYMEIYPKHFNNVWNVFHPFIHVSANDKDRDICIKKFCELAKYDTSWEWIMPVVERIRLERWVTMKVSFIIYNDFIVVSSGIIVDEKPIGDGFYFKVDGSGIHSVYDAVVKYLEL